MRINLTLTLLLGLCLAAVTSPAAVIDTIAGTGQTADGGSGGVAVKTNIGNPFGVEIGPDGALYITEVTNHRVRRLDLNSRQLTTVAGNGKKGYAGDGGPATEASLNEPYEVRFDGEGNMYFVEMQNHLLRKVDRNGRISTVAGTGTAGYGGDGGPALAAQFRSPHSIALDGRGGLYVADIGNHRIRRIDLDKGTIESIAGNGERQLPQDGEPIKDRPILGPRALFVSGRTMWIALREGNSVWRMNLDAGTLHHVSGTGEKGFMPADKGLAKQATFNGPKGIALGKNPNLVYVADTENQVIRRIDVAAGTISTIAGSGPQARGYGGDGGSATQAKLNRPHGICVGPDGAVYIGDSENHRVRLVKE
jgi:sugar lactone lactonase YvrE